MNDRYPAYYLRFHCRAGDCTDSCCRKWEIDIDPDSLSRFKSDSGVLSQKLRETIVEESDGSAHFRLTPDGNCPFLQDDGLCEMILKMGERSLCQICTDHPRFFRETGGVRECGVGLCCEAAAEMILDPREDDSLIGAEGEETDLSALRGSLLENMTSLLQSWWENAWIWKEETLASLLASLQKQEILSPRWAELLNALSGKLAVLLQNRTVLPWESDFLRLGRYFLFRHFLRAEEYEDPEDGIQAETQLLFLCLTLLYLLYATRSQETGTLSQKDRIDLCKLFSQEVEYDEDILELLEDFAG